MNYLDAAEEFIAEGFNPLPLKLNKSPHLDKNHTFLYYSIEGTPYMNNFRKSGNIGVACGKVSENFYCLDFDQHKGDQNVTPVYEEFVDQPWVAELISDGYLSCNKSPSGGYHIYFRFPKEDEPIKGHVLASWKDNGVMIEWRGHGQYMAVAPSPGYEHIGGVELLKITPLEHGMYQELSDLARYFSLGEVEHEDGTPKGERIWNGEWSNKSIIGQFNNECAEEAREILTNHGWRYLSSSKDDVERWLRPGKEASDMGSESSATFGKRRNMFYVFSGAASPFLANKAYSPFDILKLLEFKGDAGKARESLIPEVEPLIVEDKPLAPEERFPVEVFPPFVQKLIIEMNNKLNFHMDFSAIGYMFTISTAFGNKYKLKMKNGWETPPLFWFMAVGDPGTMKSHPLSMMISPLQKWDIKNLREYTLRYDEWERTPKKDRKDADKPESSQTIINDGTLEAIQSTHNTNPKGLGYHKDELAGFVMDMNKYRQGSDEQFWLESFNNGRYVINRKTQKTFAVDKICINIIGTIQPDVVKDIAADQSNNGFMDRFLYTNALRDAVEISDEDISTELLEAYNNAIIAQMSKIKYSNESDTEFLPLDKECFKIYQAFDREMVKKANDPNGKVKLKSYYSKMKTYVPRFALMLTLSDHVFSMDGDSPLVITVDHMNRALVLVRYFLRVGEEVFSGISTMQEKKEVMAGLRGKTKNEKAYALHLKGEYTQKDIGAMLDMRQPHVSRAIKMAKTKKKG